MIFDIPTLTFVGGLVSFAGGLFLLVNWWQDRSVPALAIWGAALSIIGAAVVALGLHAVLPEAIVTAAAPLALDLGAALVWLAARVFNRKPVNLPLFSGAVAAWLAAITASGVLFGPQIAAPLGGAISSGIYALAALELWQGRGEKLKGRIPLVILLGLNAIGVLLTAAALASPSADGLPVPSLGWLGAIHFIAPVYSVGSAVFLVTMAKDRAEAAHRTAALIDPLTGLANRRSFMAQAQRLFDRTLRNGEPVCVLGLDLDGFKAINDTYGHAAGDQVLRIFAETLSRGLRAADIAGRMGGEEFSALLPGCSIQAASAIAGRIRSAFQDDARFVDGQPTCATVSIGVASAAGCGLSLEEVMANADRALYRAKRFGRNRVAVADGDDGDPHDGNVVRIA